MGLHLDLTDIAATRAELAVAPMPAQSSATRTGHPSTPEHRSQRPPASFGNPDGNGSLLQVSTTRLLCR